MCVLTFLVVANKYYSLAPFDYTHTDTPKTDACNCGGIVRLDDARLLNSSFTGILIVSLELLCLQTSWVFSIVSRNEKPLPLTVMYSTLMLIIETKIPQIRNLFAHFRCCCRCFYLWLTVPFVLLTCFGGLFAL